MIEQLYLKIDFFLIMPYRFIENPMLGFLLGSSILAVYCLIIGKICSWIVGKINYDRFKSDHRQMIHNHNQSLRALLAKNKAAYKAFNNEANDAFGKFFFSRMACGMATLWPVFFSLAWLNSRFADIEFYLPYHLGTVRYAFFFIALYIIFMIILGRKPLTVDNDVHKEERLLTIDDLLQVQKVNE